MASKDDVGGTYVYISYPWTEDLWFDDNFYLTTHMGLVEKHWGPFGFKSWTIVKFPKGDPSGLYIQAIMLWESVEAFEKAFDANIPEVMTDLKNYSNVIPVRYYAKVLKQGEL